MPELNATIFKLKLTDWYRHSETLLPFTPQLTEEERQSVRWLMDAWREYAYSAALAAKAAEAIAAMAAADQAHAGNRPLKNASAAFRGIATVMYCTDAQVFGQFQRALCAKASIPIPTRYFTPAPVTDPGNKPGTTSGGSTPPRPNPPTPPTPPSGPAVPPIAVAGVKFRPLGETFLTDNVSCYSSWIEPCAIFPRPDGHTHTAEYAIKDQYGRVVAHKGPKAILVNQQTIELPFLCQRLDEGIYTLTLAIDGQVFKPLTFRSIGYQAPPQVQTGGSGSCIGSLVSWIAAFFSTIWKLLLWYFVIRVIIAILGLIF